MSNYEIIKNQAELQKFIDFLPELKGEQRFMVCLFARNKFNKTVGLKADKAQLKRFTTNKENLISKLRALEIKLGMYDADGLPINQESLVVYITPNPRDMHKAGLKLIQELVKFVVDGRQIFNPQAIALNMIQSTGVKGFIDIDIDVKPNQELSVEDLTLWLDGKINTEAVGALIKTRGGFHILVDGHKVTPEFKKSWYMAFYSGANEVFDVTMNGDNMIPLPGCVQSDTYPILIN